MTIYHSFIEGVAFGTGFAAVYAIYELIIIPRLKRRKVKNKSKKSQPSLRVVK